MRTKIAWFLIGFITSWLTWSAIGYIRHRPRDYMQNWGGPLREALRREPGTRWLSNAYGLKVGNYRIFTPADSSNASAEVQSPKGNGLPGISIQDENADGTLDSILVVDSAHHHFLFADANGDGVFDSYEYTTGIGSDSKTFRDDNMDGQYDFRLGPGRAIAVYIDSQWRDVVSKGNEHYVELQGKLAPVEFYPVVRLVDHK